MKLEKLQLEVIKLIDDKNYDPISILGYLNRALQQCSVEVDVPDLKRIATVSTEVGQSYTYLSTQIQNFGGRVRRVKNDGVNLTVYASLDQLLDEYEDLTTEGDVEAVALEGNILWYAKQPIIATDLLVLFFLNPEPFAYKVMEEITWMPEAVQQDVLVHGAVSYIFGELEEEDSGQPLARRYYSFYQAGILKFKEWLSRNKQNLTYSHWSV